MPVGIEERSTVTTSSLDQNYQTNPVRIKSILKQHSSQPIAAEITIAASSSREQYFLNKDLDFNDSIVLKAVMERPKSAKHNIERYKKSFYSNYKRNMTANRNLANSTNTNYPDNENNNVIYQNHKINKINNKNNNNENLNMNDQQEVKDRKEQRMQMSKSAFAGSIAKLRPQSARHNLEKYRQDVLIEKQKNMQHKNHVQNDQFDSIMNNEEVTENLDNRMQNMENYEGTYSNPLI